VAMFVWFDKVNWNLAIPMVISSIIGGYVGASVARRLDKNVVRYLVVAIGLVLSTYYFGRIHHIW
jgi:uncharacterized membrane protein YfcA